jgi:hypothetical protein
MPTRQDSGAAGRQGIKSKKHGYQSALQNAIEIPRFLVAQVVQRPGSRQAMFDTD